MVLIALWGDSPIHIVPTVAHASNRRAALLGFTTNTSCFIGAPCDIRVIDRCEVIIKERPALKGDGRALVVLVTTFSVTPSRLTRRLAKTNST